MTGCWTSNKRRPTDPANACKAKISVIAHSMGNYLVQKAMAAAWTRKNQPLLVSLINQLVMVAADVDNDLFDAEFQRRQRWQRIGQSDLPDYCALQRTGCGARGFRRA